MATRMLIDARHPEETRVAVLQGNRIEEFDFESAEHKQIKGNIYLAKVTRVEPSLQAAFIDFGGNRHGFLAFSEIHPDYYQIPKSDRDALLAEEQAAAEEEAALRGDDDEDDDGPEDDESSEALADDLAGDELEEIDTSEKDEVATIEEGQVEGGSNDEDSDEDDDDNGGRSRRRGRGRRQGRNGNGSAKGGASSGGNRAKKADEVRAKRMNLRRRYKIQDVIHRRQVLLVQVVKEERGNKGAALTTYLSLAGRYTVLMPNSSHGGGISRKISSAGDRKRLKQIVSDLTLPKTMGLIVRTAGLSRTKTEIKRDFDYLARLWDEIREKTMSSAAPALIHSDSDLIKRAIRDIYNREIEEVIVEGEAGYKSAKAFMKLLMPSHARRVKAYSDPVPMFQRYGAEDQLKAMYDPVVQLKSGGYLVINPTEALVSIDINSGRSTKEHGIEQTALATNLEAAKEIARQLRLRDMAGLVVIDFIDMEYNNNVRKVEKCMKDALKNDRARIQVGRISSFGLMEMSRQRLRTGVLEATTRECPHCDGTGLVRTASSAGLSALRLIEDEAAKGKGTIITLSASTEAAVYLLNQKRADLVEIEQRYGVTVEVMPEGEDEGAKMSVASSGPKPTDAPKFEPIVDDSDDDDVEDDIDTDEDEDEDQDQDQANDRGRSRGRGARSNDDEDNGNKKRRRRRGGRNRNRSRDEDQNEDGQNGGGDDDGAGNARSDNDGNMPDNGSHDDTEGEDRPKKRRRRGGRGRRKSGDDNGGSSSQDDNAGSPTAEDAAHLEQVSEQMVEDIPVASGPDDTPVDPQESAEQDAAAEKPKPKRRSRAKKADADPVAEASAADTEMEAEKPKPKRTRRKKVDIEAEAAKTPEPAAGTATDAEAPAKPKRTRRKKVDVPAEAELSSLAPEVAAVQAKPETVKASSGDAPTAPGPDSSTDAADDDSNTPKADGEASETDSRPRRGGWWQRTFGA